MQTYGIEGTYFYSGTMFLWEGYDLTFDSFTLTTLLSFCVLLVLVLAFTVNPIIAIIVVVTTGIEFLYGVSAYYWFGIEINYTNTFHIYFMVPVLVSYNVHIAHKYL